jgi:hypothetical protein
LVKKNHIHTHKKEWRSSLITSNLFHEVLSVGGAGLVVDDEVGEGKGGGAEGGERMVGARVVL